MTTTYTAICERVGKWWEITVPELESGGVTQAKRLDDVEDIVRDLVALMADVPPEDIAVKVIHVYKIHIREEDQSYWASVEELPGCFATGETWDELQASLAEAIGLHLSTRRHRVSARLGEASKPKPSKMESVVAQRVLVS